MGSEGAHSSRAEEARLIKADKDRDWSPWVVETADFEEEHSDGNVDFMTVQLWPTEWGWLCNKHEYGSTRCAQKARLIRARARVRVSPHPNPIPNPSPIPNPISNLHQGRRADVARACALLPGRAHRRGRAPR